ncbi:hypothetical protein ABGT23_01710 [Enterobacter cloacae]|uniref:hypothetical protein n=1 Tax=Enterobacter cloacae TaxID=550 RepID=UPI00345D4C4C
MQPGHVVFAENYLRDTAWQDRRFIMELIKEAVEEGYGLPLTPLINSSDDMRIFRNLAPAPWTESYFELPAQAEAWLTVHMRECSLVISYEMPEWMRVFLDRHHIPWLDIRLSPLRFSLDLMLAVRSSDESTNTFLRSAGIAGQTIRMFASQMRASSRRLLNMHSEDSDDHFRNSLVFIGQTASDAALIAPPGKLLSVSDYSRRLKMLSEGKEHIYYHPHPFAGEHQTYEIRTLSEVTGREVRRTDTGTSALLAMRPGAVLTGISSGLLQEANYFHQRCEILFRPICPLEGDLAYAQFYIADLMSANFWRNVSCPGAIPFMASQGIANQLRYLHNLWFSFDNHIMEKGPGKAFAESSRNQREMLINLETRLLNLERSWKRLSGSTVFRMLKVVRRLFSGGL